MAKKVKTGKSKAGKKTGRKNTAAAPQKKQMAVGAARPKSRTTVPGNKTSEIVFTSLAVGTLGVLGYFGWKHYKKKKGADNIDVDEAIKSIKTLPDLVKPAIYPPAKPPRVKTTATENRNDDFPLKKGSKGERVRQLQTALIAKYGKSVLPRYGADGDFGTETANALQKNNLPAAIDESTFNVLVQSSSAGAGDSSGHAKKIYDAVRSKNLNSVISLLKGIQNKEQYQLVSNSFMPLRLGGVRQTLVNGVLSSFSGADQKQRIRMEFARMGLRYDGSKWSLSGFDGKSIVTVDNATVWISPTKSITVPARVVLGSEVTQRLDYTLFENNNQYFLVKTQSVKYL